MSQSRILAFGLLAVLAWPAASWAGGPHGGGPMMFRPGAAGGFHGAPAGGFGGRRAMPPIGGTIHVRNGGSVFSGFGHTNTAPGLRFGAGMRAGGGFGHTNTALPRIAPGFAGGAGRFYGHTNTGFGLRGGVNGGRLILARPYRGVQGRPVRYGYGYGAYRPGYGYGYGAGGYYGAGLSAAPVVAAGGYPVVSYGAGAGYGGYAPAGNYGAGYAGEGYGGYAEPPLAGAYAEPPLNGFGGAPLVINGGAPAAGCRCAPSPVVYRYGVGSYY